MITAQKIIYNIINGDAINIKDLEKINDEVFEEFENLAILYHIKLSKKKYDQIKETIETKILTKKLSESYYLNHKKKEYRFILNAIIKNKVIPKKYFDFIYFEIKNKKIELDYLAVLLIHIYYIGLNQENLLHLTNAMIESGNIYDYRNSTYLLNSKLVRRYPTGALSEKLALLLPALLSHYHKLLNIYSPFLIAKSLGFTGGTWDKLSVLENIKFSAPEKVKPFTNTLRNCGVAYCMTEGNVAPFDKFLYQFRSLTGTINSKSLIISSIASKQLAIPVDFLLLDFRYGEGSFINSIDEALNIGQDLAFLLENKGIPCKVLYTNTEHLNGISIGNFWELYEAICILKGEFKNEFLKLETSQTQIELLINFFTNIFLWVLPNTNANDLKNELSLKLTNGTFYKSFVEIMSWHNISEVDIEAIYKLKDFDKIDKFEIFSTSHGVLERINQKDLGILINYELNNNNYDFFKPGVKHTKLQGAILHKIPGDSIRMGEKLCTIFSNKKIEPKEVEKLFTIKTVAKVC